MATYYSYDDIHKIDAWQDNNITLMLTQDEGLNGETGSNTYVKRPTFQLKDERGIISIPTTGARLELAFTRKDGTTGSLGSNEISASDGENGIVSFTVKPTLTSVAGKIKGEIRLITSNAVIKFYGVNFYVKKGVSNQDAIESEDFDDLIKAIQELTLITPEGVAILDTLDENGELPTNGTNPVASGVLKMYLGNHYEKYKKISLNDLNNRDTHLDPQTIYKVHGHGLVVAANDFDGLNKEETQYYFAEDGIMRYRHRKKVNGEWEDWDSKFIKFESEENKTEILNGNSTINQYPTAKTVYDNIILFKKAIPNNQTPSDDSVRVDDAIDTKTIYSYNNGQGYIITSTTSLKQTQYYFAEDGIMRYRHRKKVNGEWEDWDNSFNVMINEENLSQNLDNNLNPYLSPQNKLDKYFVKTCIDKSKVKLNKETKILGFGDSIMSKGYGGSWMDKVQERIGFSDPINMAVGGAQFVIGNTSQLLSTQLTNFLEKVDNHQIDASTINLVIISAGTNDAYNGTPIDSFQSAVNSFFDDLQNGFESRELDCPPVLVITPIRRGKESEINSIDNNIELKIAKYSAVLNNSALEHYFSVLNGFDIPVLVDDMNIDGVSTDKVKILSFMYKTKDSGDSYDDILHVHPNPTVGVNTYAQSVINAIGVSDDMNGDISTKMDLAPLNPTAEQIAALSSGQLYSDTANHKGAIKGGQEFYDTDYINRNYRKTIISEDRPPIGAPAGTDENIIRTGDVWVESEGKIYQCVYTLYNFSPVPASIPPQHYYYWKPLNNVVINSYVSPPSNVVHERITYTIDGVTFSWFPFSEYYLDDVYHDVGANKKYMLANEPSGSIDGEHETYYYTWQEADYYTKTEINNMIGDIGTRLDQVRGVSNE